MAQRPHIDTNLREFRTEARFTQQQLATRAGLVTSSVQRIEYEGAGGARGDTLLALAKALRVSVVELVPRFDW